MYCGVLHFQAKPDKDEPVIRTKAVGMKVTGKKCEIEGILVGMEHVLQFVSENTLWCIYIFSMIGVMPLM